MEPGYRSEGRRRWDTHCYFCCTLAGEGTFWNERGEYRLLPNTGFLCEINDPRTGYRAEPGWQFLAFEFTGLAARAMVRDLLARYGPVYTLDPMAPILRRLLSFETQGTAVVPLDGLDGAELVLELLLALADSARTQEAPDAAGDLVTRAMHLIHDSEAPGMSVEAVAEAVGVSREGLDASLPPPSGPVARRSHSGMEGAAGRVPAQRHRPAGQSHRGPDRLHGLHELHPRLPQSDGDDAAPVPPARQQCADAGAALGTSPQPSFPLFRRQRVRVYHSANGGNAGMEGIQKAAAAARVRRPSGFHPALRDAPAGGGRDFRVSALAGHPRG